MNRRTALCAIASLLFSVVVSAQPLEVVKLTPKSFEHETQAATGQTTGHWCVLFTNSSSSSSLQVAAEDAWEHLAEDEDKSTILAKVDLSADGGAALAKRLNLTTSSSPPTAILFRDRSMYPLSLADTAADADKIAAAVHAFMDGGYEHQEPHPVPPETTLIDMVVEAAQMLKVSPTPMLWIGVALLALGVVLFLGFVGAGIWYMYAPDKPKQPAAAAKAAAAAKKNDDAGAAAAAGGADDDNADDAEGSSAAATGKATRRRRAA